MSSESTPLVVPLDALGMEWVTIGPLSEARGWGICHSLRFGVSILRPTLFLRFGLGTSTQRPPVVVREIWSSDPQGLSARALRDLPLARIEACLNQPLHYEEARARSAALGAPTTPFPWPNGSPPRWWFAHPEPVEAPSPVLAVPPGRPKPDAFYRQVAEVFAHLTTTTARPANVIAEANAVPVTQVHGWVKEARRRGLLAAGERSRRGVDAELPRPAAAPAARIPGQTRTEPRPEALLEATQEGAFATVPHDQVLDLRGAPRGEDAGLLPARW